MSDNKIRVGITQGDTNGIGWEVIIKTFADSRMAEMCTPVIYGSPKVATYYKNRLSDVEGFVYNPIQSASQARRGKVNIIDCGPSEIPIEIGKATAAAGAAAVAALKAAVKDLKEGEIDVLVTAPINKESAQSDEFRYTGHTEFLAAELEGEPMMMMCSEVLRVGLMTIHIPLAEVSKAISKEKIVEALRRLRATLRSDFAIVEPRIAVLALNPHAGDGGLLGKEEQEVIRPAVQEAFEQKVLAFGPFAADGFFASGAFKKYDAVLAMYHDQGLAPFKTISPEGVNFTAALSEVRTSPDHGVAYDIAGKDVADPQSMREAIYAAIDIFENRRRWAQMNANPLQHFEREKGRDVSVHDLKLPEAAED